MHGTYIGSQAVSGVVLTNTLKTELDYFDSRRIEEVNNDHWIVNIEVIDRENVKGMFGRKYYVTVRLPDGFEPGVQRMRVTLEQFHDLPPGHRTQLHLYRNPTNDNWSPYLK